MSLLMAIFLGLVQGVTEFLPVSSSGHLSILQNLIGLKYVEEEHLFFDVLLHLGTLIAICVVYRKELKLIFTDAKDFFKNLRGGADDDDERRLKPSLRTAVFVIIGTLPLFVMLPFYGMISKLYYKTAFIGFALIITGTILFVADRFIKPGRKDDKTITLKDAIIIGCAQAVALIPGLSRSGTTITTGLAQGLEREYAVKFSLLLSLPAVLGSTLLSLISAFSGGINWKAVPAYLVGLAVAAVVGYFAIKLIQKIVDNGKFGKFSYYCWAVGLLAIILSLIL